MNNISILPSPSMISEEQKKREMNIWKIILTMIVTGLVLIIAYAVGWASSFKAGVSVLSIGILIGGAFFTIGALAGFLFGIPKLIQNINPDGKTDKTRIVHNDNLVQISDWLTKIIVGVGLTQLYNIPGYTLRMAEKITSQVDTSYGFNVSIIISIILYFTVLGFLSTYMWTRIYFVKLLFALDKELDPLAMIDKKFADNMEEQNRRLATTNKNLQLQIELGKIESKIESFEKTKTKLLNIENNLDDLKQLLKNISLGPIKVLDDPQKGRWGGLATSSGISLTASYVESPDQDYDRKIFTVTLTVRGSIGHELTGTVYFFLHDSFLPNNIMKADPVGNVAQISIDSYEASTVGALCNGGTIALELDLNMDINSPAEYRYTETLISIDELNAQKQKIVAEIAQQQEEMEALNLTVE
jgi:hypothetical protein